MSFPNTIKPTPHCSFYIFWNQQTWTKCYPIEIYLQYQSSISQPPLFSRITRSHKPIIFVTWGTRHCERNWLFKMHTQTNIVASLHRHCAPSKTFFASKKKCKHENFKSKKSSPISMLNGKLMEFGDGWIGGWVWGQVTDRKSVV